MDREKMNEEQPLQQALEEKVAHYESLTKKALEKVSLRENLDKKAAFVANDFLQMAKNYYHDALFFKHEGQLLTALAAFSYSHAWLDAGVRSGLLDGQNDDQLFVLP